MSLAALKFEDFPTKSAIFYILRLLSLILGIDNTSYPPTSDAEFLHVLLNYTTEVQRHCECEAPKKFGLGRFERAICKW